MLWPCSTLRFLQIQKEKVMFLPNVMMRRKISTFILNYYCCNNMKFACTQSVYTHVLAALETILSNKTKHLGHKCARGRSEKATRKSHWSDGSSAYTGAVMFPVSHSCRITVRPLITHHQGCFSSQCTYSRL